MTPFDKSLQEIDKSDIDSLILRGVSESDPDRRAETFEDRLHPARPARIVHHREIDLARDDVAAAHRVATRGAGDYSFGQGVWHGLPGLRCGRRRATFKQHTLYLFQMR